MPARIADAAPRSPRRAPGQALRRLFAVLGGLLLLYLAAPVLTILLGASPAALGQTLVDAETLRSWRVTLTAAGIATALGLMTGVPLAYLLARPRPAGDPRPWGRRLIEGLLGLPVIIPHTSAGVALLLTWGARGPLGRPLGALGLFFTDRLAGIVLAMLFVGVPFLVATARVAFAGLNPELEQAAWVDGASGWVSFWRVTLPLARRGVASGALMMWARGISEFGAVVLLAYHPRTLAVLVYERFQGYGLPAATPLAALMVLMALAVFALASAWGEGEEE
jgi:molybdate/tungstate transport system permease protein